jgi:hypothetical protein
MMSSRIAMSRKDHEVERFASMSRSEGKHKAILLKVAARKNLASQKGTTKPNS